jgi:hypothetical protein
VEEAIVIYENVKYNMVRIRVRYTLYCEKGEEAWFGAG